MPEPQSNPAADLNRKFQSWRSQWNPWTDVSVGLVFLALFLAALWYLFLATQDVAWWFGWIVGSSLSSIASVVAPLVFGLLATVVFASVRGLAIAAAELTYTPAGLARFAVSFIAVIILCNLTTWFCWESKWGYKTGSEVRQKYKEKMLRLEAEIRIEKGLRPAPGITPSTAAVDHGG